jgi:hypothetical protein
MRARLVGAFLNPSTKEAEEGAGGVAQVVEHLPSKHGAFS